MPYFPVPPISRRSCIHMRLTDKVGSRLYPDVDLSYYQKALRAIPRSHVLGFSDDPLRAASILPAVTWSAADDPVTDFANLASCSAIVVGFSSFSWWAAFLSNATCIIAPRRIYRAAGAEGYALGDYYPKSWIVL